ncbi:hypothetical protein ACH5RR_013316 [Cinchona calisaya]|uniref:Uncharacterized protein n=1 Tax=Cinchona calisaya TaxID=153742 RepID=A0ABD3A107_9GENT
MRDKLCQADAEKNNLEVDVGDRDQKITNLEQRVLQIQEEAQLAEAKFASREVELRIEGKNQFVASVEADEMLKEFTKKVFSMGFTLACDHLVKNPDLYEGCHMMLLSPRRSSMAYKPNLKPPHRFTKLPKQLF